MQVRFDVGAIDTHICLLPAIADICSIDTMILIPDGDFLFDLIAISISILNLDFGFDFNSISILISMFETNSLKKQEPVHEPK